jgi:chaperonin cofactor prefoldin
MRGLACRFFGCLLMCVTAYALQGQGNARAPGESSSSSTADSGSMQLEQKLEAISGALATTQQQLEQSQRQIQQLQEELIQVRKQLGASTQPTEKATDVADPQIEKRNDLQERVETLEAQVKLHEQTKVESGSKYPVRLTGLILFNSFVNRGTVDNIDLPSVALSSTSGSNGSVGAGLRQTILGIEAYGPRIAGAKTSANVSLDFFGGLPFSNFGTSAGLVRMRTAGINLDWAHDSLQVGMESPLISPLSPTSYATVAEPGMAWAGNLWTWAPQFRYAHQFIGPDNQHLQVELGLWDPPDAGYNSATNVFRVPSPGEKANQPAYEGRVSYGSASEERRLQIGLGGYYSRQSYSITQNNEPYTQGNDSWAFTTDWRVPFGHRFEVSGEGYRGRSLGGLGGGVYKNVLYGTNPISGEAVIRGLNDIGGWIQFKSHLGQMLEANASMGLDNGFARDFHEVVPPPMATATQLLARNRMAVGNLIYRPKTYLILSPEYRRIWTWPISATRSTADIFTLSVGYQF